MRSALVGFIMVSKSERVPNGDVAVVKKKNAWGLPIYNTCSFMYKYHQHPLHCYELLCETT